MKGNRGVTLLEILLAISLLTLIIIAGGGICLSGMNLSVDAQYSAQAHRNAQIAMMHIEKNARKSASEFEIMDSGRTVTFNAYRSLMRSRYAFSDDLDSITYIPDILNPTMNTIVFNHISSCDFNITPGDGVILDVAIEAFDNNNRARNICRLETSVEAAYASSSRV